MWSFVDWVIDKCAFSALKAMQHKIKIKDRDSILYSCDWSKEMFIMHVPIDRSTHYPAFYSVRLHKSYTYLLMDVAKGNGQHSVRTGFTTEWFTDDHEAVTHDHHLVYLKKTTWCHSYDFDLKCVILFCTIQKKCRILAVNKRFYLKIIHNLAIHKEQYPF